MVTAPKLWSPSQQKGLLCLCVVLLVFLTIELIRKPATLNDPPGVDSPRADEIQDRLDPNTADAAALSAIPNIGEVKANDIVNYRENFVRQHPGRAAFGSIDQLRQVKGIGPATVVTLDHYLIFPNGK